VRRFISDVVNLVVKQTRSQKIVSGGDGSAPGCCGVTRNFYRGGKK